MLALPPATTQPRQPRLATRDSGVEGTVIGQGEADGTKVKAVASWCPLDASHFASEPAGCAIQTPFARPNSERGSGGGRDGQSAQGQSGDLDDLPSRFRLSFSTALVDALHEIDGERYRGDHQLRVLMFGDPRLTPTASLEKAQASLRRSSS